MNWTDFLLPNGRDDYRILAQQGDAAPPSWGDQVGRVLSNVRFAAGKGNQAFGFNGGFGANQQLRDSILDLVKQMKGRPGESPRNVQVITGATPPTMPGMPGMPDLNPIRSYNPLMG